MSSDGPLQFDRVEPGSETNQAPRSADACSNCGAVFQAPYYRIAGHSVCERCKDAIRSRFTGTGGARTFIRAALVGLAGAAVGSGIYYAVREATGYEIGFIAIVVGLLVGGAVRKGCGTRGGPVYQGLAMLLTYMAIGSTYLPIVYQAAKEHRVAKEKTDKEGAKTASAAIAAAPDEATTATISRAKKPPAGIGKAVGVVLVVSIAIALAAPIVTGFESPMGFVLLAIALYEAWRMNKRPKLEFVGPIALPPSTANDA